MEGSAERGYFSSRPSGRAPSVDEAAAELRRDFQEELNEEREEEKLREQFDYMYDDFSSELSEAATSEQVIEIVDRYSDAFFTVKGEGMPAWMVINAAECLGRIQFPEGTKKGEMDLRPALGCILELVGMTDRILLSDISSLEAPSEDIMALRLNEALNSPVTAYLRLHMPDAGDWKEEKIRQLIEGAAHVSSSKLIRDILNQVRKENVDYSNVLRRFVEINTRYGANLTELSKKMILLEALDEQEAKGLSVSLGESKSKFYAALAKNFASLFYTTHESEGREAALAELDESLAVICEYEQRVGLVHDRQRFMDEISNEIWREAEDQWGIKNETVLIDLALIKKLRVFSMKESIPDSVYSLSPSLLWPILEQDHNGALSYAEQLADAVGYSWKPGEVWPNKQDREQMVVGTLKKCRNFPWGSDVDAKFDFLRDQFGITPDDIRAIEVLVGDERVHSIDSPEQKAGLVWQKLLDGVMNPDVNSDGLFRGKLWGSAHDLWILERIYGKDSVQRPEILEKPSFEKIIALLNRNTNEWTGDTLLKQKGKFVNVFLRMCYRDLEAEFRPLVERGMEQSDPASLRPLFEWMRFCEIPIRPDPEFFNFHVVRSSGNKLLEWTGLWQEFSEGPIPIDDRTKYFLLTDFLRTAEHYGNNHDAFQRTLEFLRSEHSGVLEKQRDFIRRSDFFANTKHLPFLRVVCVVFGIRPAAIPSHFINLFLQDSSSYEAMTQVFGEELLIAAMNAMNVTGVPGLRLRKFVLKERAFLEKCASQAVDPDRSVPGLLLRLSALRAPSANADHDPWSNGSLESIFRGCASFVGLNASEWADRLVSYVKLYGMAYLPELMHLHFDIAGARSFNDLSTGTREMLRELGIRVSPDESPDRWPYQSPAEITTELKRYVSRMSEALLRDEIPKGMSTRVGQELFKSVL